MSHEQQHDNTSVYSIGSKTNLVAVKSRDTYFKRTRKKSTMIILILSLLIAGLMGGVGILGFYLSKVKAAQPLCDTEECVRIAASLKESMDTSIPPCDDFYKYACGRWPEHHPTPDTSMMNSWFNEKTEKVTWRIRELLRQNLTNVPWAVNQAQILFNSCVNIDAMDALGLTPLLNFLRAVDLPQVPAILGNKDGNFIKKIAKVRRFLGKDVLIGFFVTTDPRNRTRNVIVLDSPSSLSPLPGDKEIEKRLKTLRTRMARQVMSEEEMEEGVDINTAEIERNYITAVIKEIISNGTSLSCDKNTISPAEEARIAAAAESIYQLNGILYYLSRSDSNQTLTDENISDRHYMLVDDLQRITDAYVRSENSSLVPRKIWRPFIEELCRDIVELDLNGKDRIFVGNLAYLQDLAVLLASTEDEKLESIIWWTVVEVVAPHSSSNLREIWSDYIDKLINIEDYDPRSIHCADVTNYMMGMAVSRLFVDPQFHNKTGPKVIEMLEHIRASFAYLLDTESWMDKLTRQLTIEKSKKMVYVIGHPEWLFDNGTLNDYYEGVDMKENAYLENMLLLANLASKMEIEFVRQTNNMDDIYWAAEPTDVNAVYSTSENHITVPAGILQFPFYDLGLEALNYGAIGTILGHELTHGFDNSGRMYDSDGNLREWWTNNTILEYEGRVKCFIDHYGEYYEKEINEYVDGELTLDENIADNGGLREAVHAYRRWKAIHGQEPKLPGFTHLTHEQLLFLAFAHMWCEAYNPESLRWMLRDSHSPGHVRLTAVLKNSVEFSEAWQCPEGTNMNPVKKCHIW